MMRSVLVFGSIAIAWAGGCKKDELGFCQGTMLVKNVPENNYVRIDVTDQESAPQCLETVRLHVKGKCGTLFKSGTKFDLLWQFRGDSETLADETCE